MKPQEVLTEVVNRCIREGSPVIVGIPATTQPNASATAKLKRMQTEIGTGEPGYRWVERYLVVGPDGSEYYPTFTQKEAKAFCKSKGWLLSPVILQ